MNTTGTYSSYACNICNKTVDNYTFIQCNMECNLEFKRPYYIGKYELLTLFDIGNQELLTIVG